MRFSSPNPSPSCPTTSRPIRVLLVDDQPMTRLAIQHLLRTLNYEVDTAANGCEALETLEGQEYDIVLMDLMMPVMDGLEATRRLRMLPSNRVRPIVIAMTADDTLEDRALCQSAGMNDFVAKPLTRNRLVEALERCQLPTSAPVG